MIARYIFGCFLLLIGLVDYHHCAAQNKFSPKIISAPHGRQSTAQKFSVCVNNVALFTSAYRNRMKFIHQDLQAKIFVINASIGFVMHAFANDSNILFVDMVAEPREESSNNNLNMAINRINKAQELIPDLTGSDFTISIKENSIDENDLDLRGRTFQTTLSPPTSSQHATAMATFIAGAGNSSEKGLGVVPGARVTSADFSNIFPDPLAYFTTNNIRQQNHSYGVSIENYYGNEALAYDNQLHLNPDLIHVFSAGNIGTSKPTVGAYKDFDWSNLSGNFKQAKNVLVITAVDTTHERNVLNSRGPAYDGRLKPELTAHGQDGTSDAAALTSGMITRLRQCLQRYGWGVHSSALIKALLIASADDIGPPGIDFTFGYGNINLFQALMDVQGERFSQHAIEPGQSMYVAITIPNGVREVRVATTWIDPPAIVNSQKALINDVDTYLDYQEQQMKPWVLSHFPHVDSLSAESKRKEDHLNNVELITIVDPIPGTHNLVIDGSNLFTRQEVSVAYSFKVEELRWDYPNENTVIEAGVMSTALWNRPLEPNGSMSLRLNHGEWHVIKSTVGVGEAYTTWKTPDTLSIAELRLEVNGEYLESPSFIISPRPKLKVPFRCDDQFALSWQPIPGTDNYQIKTLISNSLSVASETIDTIKVFESGEQPYFSVVPVVQGRIGLPAQTIDYREQGAQCYINLFAAYRFDDDRNKLELQLSTYWNVRQVDFYRVVNGTRQLLESSVPGQQTRFEIFDVALQGGLMQYVADVTLLDGTTISADVVDLLVEEKGKAILFPNPAFESMINVLSEGKGQRLRIIDRQGKTLAVVELGLYVEQVDLTAFTPGLYFFQLENGDRVISSGRFLKM